MVLLWVSVAVGGGDRTPANCQRIFTRSLLARGAYRVHGQAALWQRRVRPVVARIMQEGRDTADGGTNGPSFACTLHECFAILSSHLEAESAAGGGGVNASAMAGLEVNRGHRIGPLSPLCSSMLHPCAPPRSR